MELTPVEARVLGCLVEKQRTVPDTYPLTANALVSACNQTSSRDPIMRVGEGDVVAAVDGLKSKGLARIVHPSAGSRSTKYRHVADEALGLDDAALSVLAVLLLRGPQTAAELRSRTERLHTFGDQDEVDAVLATLAAAGLADRADTRRWRQTLAPVAATVLPVENHDDPGLGERVTALEAEVAELRSVVDRLRALLS